MIRHIAFMKFKTDVAEAKIEQLLNNLKQLEKAAEGILTFSWGKNISPQDNLRRGFTHCFIFDFENAQARDHYLAHPLHLERSNAIVPYLENGLEDVLVFDYRA